MTKPQLPNLEQTDANTILITNISNSNLNKFWVGIFTRQGHINQVYETGVSQSVSDTVSEWQALPMIELGSDKNGTSQFCDKGACQSVIATKISGKRISAATYSWGIQQYNVKDFESL